MLTAPATARLAALSSTELLDSEPELSFDRLTRLAARLLAAPVSLVSLVDRDRQFFKSAHGLAEPWKTRRETPLSHSFCQTVTGQRRKLVVPDAREHPLLRDNLAIRDLNVVAYAGIPLFIDDQAIGAFCVIDDKPREWAPEQVAVLEDLAASAVAEIELRRALRDARREHAIYRAIVQHLPGGAVFMVDQELRYVSADGPMLPEMLRRTEIPGLIGRYVADVVSPANRDAILDAYRAALRGESQNVEIERDGRFFEVSTVPITEEAAVTHAMVFSYDVTDRRREALELAQARDRLTHERSLLVTTLANITDAVALLDADRHILLGNQAYADLLGVPAEALPGTTPQRFFELIAPQLEDVGAFAADFASNGDRPASQEYVLARPRRRVFQRRWTPLRLAGGNGILVTWRDITAERDLLHERERLLLVDPLTGIPNRRAGETALRTEHERTKRLGSPMCVALFDVDHFKLVNDRHGHPVGDEVLRVVAAALAGSARVTDTVARWGGEEFLAVLNVPLEGGRVFCERVRATIEGLRVPPVERLTISAGVAAVAPGEAVAAALTRADAQLYAAKSAGRNRVHG